MDTLLTINPAESYPLLPLRDTAVFPQMVVPLFVGRAPSKAAVEHAFTQSVPLFVVAQREGGDGYPTEAELYPTGILCRVLQVLTLPDGTLKVLVRGGAVGHLRELKMKGEFYMAHLTPQETPAVSSGDVEMTEPLMRALKDRFEVFVGTTANLPTDLLPSVMSLTNPHLLAYTIASYLSLGLEDKQKLLQVAHVDHLLEAVLEQMERHLEAQNIEKRVRERVRAQIEKTHRDYVLQEQMRALRQEMDLDEEEDELELLRGRIEKAELPAEANERAMAEWRKLRRMNPMAPDASVVRTYIDWLLDLPWHKVPMGDFTLVEAQKILDADHYGLEDVKDRIIEYLAVQKRVGSSVGEVLCFVGPPGVGKTSLARSIAQATGRPFVRISLGGVHDEAEIRGHRRTYIGAMPGRIIQAMKKAKATNPLILLDEIDKTSADWRGDPMAGLLEVLDPEQNKAFVDHYLDVGYDLSDVLFLATANTLNLPRPLLDRMEIIRLSGYTEEEKLAIAERYLVPKQRKAHSLSEGEFKISKPALQMLLRLYTREAGVRAAEREIAKVARKAVRLLAAKPTASVAVTPKNLEQYLGIPRFKGGGASLEDQVGVTHGLAWTEVGGEVLLVEAVITPGRGNVKVTGKLGDVMQESAQAAVSYVRSRATTFGIPWELLEKRDIHIHVPEGATPKDGPSAGVALCTSIVSILRGIPVRGDIAMTGEISLQGRILPVGGIKEKILAAYRAGMKMILIPEENVKDLQEVPDSVKNRVVIQPVKRIEQVLEYGLTERVGTGEWLPQLLLSSTGLKQGDENTVTH